MAEIFRLTLPREERPALLVLWLCWIRARRTSSWWGSLGVHWGLFVWLCVFAFPWLGEMI